MMTRNILLNSLAIIFVSSFAMGQTITENYIKNTIYRVETQDGITNASNQSTLTDDDKIETIGYFDGLGRSIQNIAIRAGGNNEDVVTHIDYDDYGRQTKEYLPFADVSNDGSYRNNALQLTNTFYNTLKYENTLNPYSEKHLEPSPLNRVLEQGAPGADWEINTGSDADHTIKHEYTINSDADLIRHFDVDLSTGSPQLLDLGIYQSSKLHKTIIKDENWQPNQQCPNDHTIEEYIDLEGRVILKRTFDLGKWHDTYYVYDGSGNLTYVLPPKVTTYKDILQQSWVGQSFNFINEIDMFTFETSFNGLYFTFGSDGTMSFKIVAQGSEILLKDGFIMDLDFSPSIPNMDLGQITFMTGENAGSVYINSGKLYFNSSGGSDSTSGNLNFNVSIDLLNYKNDFIAPTIDQNQLDGLAYQYTYDDKNRLIQKKIPGKQKEIIIYDRLNRPVMTQDAYLKPLNKWLFTKFDVFGRVAYNGIYTHPTDIDQQAMQEYFIEQNTLDPYNINFINRAKTFEEKLPTGGYQNTYYTNDDFPKSNIDILTVNYYDDYWFGHGFINPIQTSQPYYQISFADNSNTNISILKNPIGLLTGSKVKVLDTNDWIINAIYYDAELRQVCTYSKNEYLNTEDKIKNKLDFNGNKVATETTHTKTGISPIITIDYFEYDHIGRQKRQSQLLSGSMEVVSENYYNELGRLVRKGVGGKVNQPRLQNIQYTYNIRGWLSQINDPVELGNSLFGLKVCYNYGKFTTVPLYNGGVSSIEWKTANIDNSRKYYKFNYDSLDRLTRATDNTGKYRVSYIIYDRNWNITNLARIGHVTESPSLETLSGFGVMDKLIYEYEPKSNKLLKVTDISPGNAQYGFKDGNTIGDDYAYDTNGNMVVDKNKGISTIAYNLLNLPTHIDINDGGGHEGTIDYIYDAMGAKLEKNVTQGTETIKTLYSGNYVYKDSPSTGIELQFFNHPEGYVDAVNGYKYVYQYKDHLGNVRLSYMDSNGDGQITASTEILEENNYYPFGLKHEGYNSNPVTNHPYKYSSKELNDELGLDWYDYGARNYDPALGRWMNLDPLAEKFTPVSPYIYAANSPLRFIDLDGKDIININGGVRFTGRDAQIAFSALQNSYNSIGAIPKVHFVNESITPEIYEHTLEAFRSGKPNILRYDSDKKRRVLRRASALALYPSRYSEGLTRDEYPYASTFEGGLGAAVAYVSIYENSRQGWDLKELYKTLEHGEAFLVLPVPEEREPETVPEPIVEPVFTPEDVPDPIIPIVPAPATKPTYVPSIYRVLQGILNRIPVFIITPPLMEQQINPAGLDDIKTKQI